MGVEKAPQIIYSRLLKYHAKFNKNLNLDNQESVSEYCFEMNKGYNMIYNKYAEFSCKNNHPIITIGGDHSVAMASCQAFKCILWQRKRLLCEKFCHGYIQVPTTKTQAIPPHTP